MELDFKDDLSGKRFTFDNPNAKKDTCGCGESFSI
jgi:Fe-S cluster assembly iron-binding protein IscA